MLKHRFSIALLFFVVTCVTASGTQGPVDPSQEEYEQSISAVVRHKQFYKSGRFEFNADAGMMPYDSIVNHTLFGGRLTWHLSDHYGWEIIDGQVALPSVTSYATGLVQERGIANLQDVKLKTVLATNFLLSPIYGKIRFIGDQVLFFDFYISIGGGVAKTQVFRYNSPAEGSPGVESTVSEGWDPMASVGIGVKIFVNPMLGFVIDMRDYIVASNVYGSRRLKNNFSVFAGFSFFLPGLG